MFWCLSSVVFSGVVIGGLVQKLSSSLSPRDLLRVAANLEMKGRHSFSFTVENEVSQQDGHDNEKSSSDKSIKFQSRRRVDHVISDLAKFIGKEKVPAKVLKEVGELISLTLSQAQNHQPLSGSTIFNRIEIPTSFDPLNGLYIGAYGLYSSEIIQMRRRYGQWHEDGRVKETLDLEFYEYVEALKLIGDPYVPVGQLEDVSADGKKHTLTVCDGASREIINMEVKMFNLKAENQRLKEEVANHAKLLAELDTTRAKIELLNKDDLGVKLNRIRIKSLLKIIWK
ncbi:hypothetical protein TSUD_323680 [Trifolium subterraneum]|uniref:Uncharacterized protein n=1 Tax=Trifolium subterraneum TaxID=3900 RepID=A0A2Z6NRP2_TRISU|nr:hypothetical protein TSUD_323680 [Trifolium subterraneum]